MDIKRLLFNFLCLLLLGTSQLSAVAFHVSSSLDSHVWEMQEVALKAENKYENYYTDVTVWVDLKGPGFSKRVYGFWDGDDTYKVRFVATVPAVGNGLVDRISMIPD